MKLQLEDWCGFEKSSASVLKFFSPNPCLSHWWVLTVVLSFYITPCILKSQIATLLLFLYMCVCMRERESFHWYARAWQGLSINLIFGLSHESHIHLKKENKSGNPKHLNARSAWIMLFLFNLHNFFFDWQLVGFIRCLNRKTPIAQHWHAIRHNMRQVTFFH